MKITNFSTLNVDQTSDLPKQQKNFNRNISIRENQRRSDKLRNRVVIDEVPRDRKGRGKR